MNQVLQFTLPDGRERTIPARYALNAGYAGRDAEQVRHHVDALAELGVPAPSRLPTLYPLSASLVGRPEVVQVAHAKTSGEAEWALVVGVDDVLLTAACDHTDRALEVHGVAWGKQSAPDLLGDVAWPLAEIEDELHRFTLKAWVRHGDTEQLIQDGTAAPLLPPSYWLKELGDRVVPGHRAAQRHDPDDSRCRAARAGLGLT